MNKWELDKNYSIVLSSAMLHDGRAFVLTSEKEAFNRYCLLEVSPLGVKEIDAWACDHVWEEEPLLFTDGQIVFAVKAEDKEAVKTAWNKFFEDVKEEFHVTDTNIVNNIEDTTATPVIEKAVADKIILALQAVDNGIYTMCQDEALEWLVETSSNIASVATDEKEMNIVASQRSNVSSNLKNMANTVRATFQLAGATVTGGDGYPAWKMNPNSLLTKIAVDSYKKLFNKEPKVLGIHAGLECGLFSEKYPNLDMVSFGPTLRYVHTPEERLLIPTVQMVWDYLLDILKNIPE